MLVINELDKKKYVNEVKKNLGNQNGKDSILKEYFFELPEPLLT